MSEDTTKTEEPVEEQEPQGAQNFEPPAEVTIGGRKIGLKAPPDAMVCREIAVAHATHEERALCAALGACWQGKGRPKARYKTDYNPLRYGGEVYNELVARGIHPREIAWAGLMAMHHCAVGAAGVPTKKEVDEAANFTDGEAASG